MLVKIQRRMASRRIGQREHYDEVNQIVVAVRHAPPGGGRWMKSFETDRIKGTRAARAVEVMKVYEDKYPVDAEDVYATLLADIMLHCAVTGNDFDVQLDDAKRQIRML
jgi:hypothetical protein